MMKERVVSIERRFIGHGKGVQVEANYNVT